MTDIRSFDLDELKSELAGMGEKPFRAKQIYKWVHERYVTSFDEMTDLSRGLREKLERTYYADGLRIVDVQQSAVDGTRKYLFGLADGNVIESVWMKYRDWDSVCISSQVGCRMGCKFCASTIDGCVRSLSAAEMLEEVYAIQKDTGERVSNIVVMGSGEPLDNYENLLKFVRMISDADGLNISQRNITVSTCGIVPKMKELAELKLQINLAVSLHAATDEKRRELMPVARKYDLKELMGACRYYFDKTGRRLTFEYALVAGINDTDQDAVKLAGLLKNINCYVNLIQVNPVRERDFKRPDHAAAVRFKNKLENFGINGTIRREMGSDIDGACGQLRRRHLAENSQQEE